MSIVTKLFYGRVSTRFFIREYPYFSFNNKFRFFLTMAESNIDPVKVSETNAKKAAKMAEFEKKKEQQKNSSEVLLLYTHNNNKIINTFIIMYH